VWGREYLNTLTQCSLCKFMVLRNMCVHDICIGWIVCIYRFSPAILGIKPYTSKQITILHCTNIDLEIEI